VVGQDVANLVANYRRELVRGPSHPEHPGVNPDLASGEGKSIGPGSSNTATVQRPLGSGRTSTSAWATQPT